MVAGAEREESGKLTRENPRREENKRRPEGIPSDTGFTRIYCRYVFISPGTLDTDVPFRWCSILLGLTAIEAYVCTFEITMISFVAVLVERLYKMCALVQLTALEIAM